ncbi:MAG: NAD-dependent epimerase/dehydratase family protein [Euzebyaceae bacterium]|jgi:nucleoside-diphosphate-sugar epimerase|nr:NAD-dependent epimerase/dehydratase family protein [Euzebyaceae bacterium]
MRALVSGGGGFLGGAIVRRLLDRGWAVRSFARGAYPALAAAGVEVLRGDLADADAVGRAVAGCDVVFHVAARAGVGGAPSAYRAANVDGTVHVVAACRRHGVGRLVFTSSPSVVHRGDDLRGADESAPYATRHLAAYPATKAAAERVVLAADGPALATTALRPHLVWGPGDTHLVPRLLARARAGRLRFVGDGRALVDSTYVDNAAEAHLLAADRLAGDGAPAGRAYFVSNGEPRPVADLVNAILRAAGLPEEHRTVPFAAAYAAGAVAEVAWRVARRTDDPPVSRFLARQLATAHWFDLTAARRDLGYVPRVSLDEGFARLAEWLRPGR